MTESENPNIQELATEVLQLRQDLQLRDQLVQQLSQELFRLVKGNNTFIPEQKELKGNMGQITALQQQLQAMEEQVTFYQEQISVRDTEIRQLRQSVQELTCIIHEGKNRKNKT